MVGRSRLISTLLCAALLMICVAGCGAGGVGDNTGEDAGVDETVEVRDAVGTGEETVAGEISGEINDAEQFDEENVEEETAFEGLGLSILGDSISTYDGWIPEGFSVFYPSEKVTDVSQTWWMRLLDDTGMELCSNNSSSGSTCAGDSLSIDDPMYGCSGYRISQLTGRQGKMPDVIIIYLGTNDLLNGIPLGDNDGSKLVEEGEIENFSDAYTLILDKVLSEYPASRIYCCTLVPVGEWGIDQPFVTFTNHLGLTSEDYSKQIQIIANNKGIPVLDLYHCGIDIDNLHEMTTDGVHLTPDGMERVERAMLAVVGGASRTSPISPHDIFFQY